MLWDLLKRKFQVTGPGTAETVHWFHLTRVPAGTTFSDGLLPLTLSLDHVWESMMAIFKRTPVAEHLSEMRAGYVDDFQYQLKVGKPLMAGPYAMLVRESAFRSRDMGNHDYLGMPEIIEDICNGYRKTYGEDVTTELVSHLQPCIVKFRSTNVRLVHSAAAAYYLYSLAHGDSLTMNANHCFDGSGVGVAREDIVGVEFPDQANSTAT